MPAVLVVLLLLSCGREAHPDADRLNDASYAWHYRNIDSTEYYALKALSVSDDYSAGRAEALNHLAFVGLVRMDYARVRRLLDSIPLTTDNQLELLVAYVQQMRLCQRCSANREFYDYRGKAMQCLLRIDEDRASLTGRQLSRLLYAKTEMAIVSSTYYYYVGLERLSSEAILSITPLVERDTTQLMNYLYNVGAGGIISAETQAEINQQELDHLLRCCLLARNTGSTFFEANALEAIAEHTISPACRKQLTEDNPLAMKFVNPDGVADEALPLWLAGRALALFRDYGDTYQIAGAYRTLASCHLAQDDYESALYCLVQALSDSAINQAPDLVASIREQLSVAFAAIDDKTGSDYNRNIYLELQDDTRQDRQLESRAGQLEESLRETELLLWAVVASLVVLLLVLGIYYVRRKHRKPEPNQQMQEQEEELHENMDLMRLQVEKGERRHLEQRAKVSLTTAIMPLIDRIIHAIDHSSMDYVGELTEEIERQNALLTKWIQLRQGEVSLHIETFGLQQLFDMVSRSEHTFAMKGVTLRVNPTAARVKADRVLTLFMLNTLADNARKFTGEGDTVSISAAEAEDYVEVSVADTGCGISEEKQASLFTPLAPETGHGFGLINCKGIIEKYRKMSSLFSVCQLSVESRVGEGSRFFFRLPKGAMGGMGLMALMGLTEAMGMYSLAAHSSPDTIHSSSATTEMVTLSTEKSHLAQASIYADSAYFSNINGTYERTLLFADSCRHCLNEHYRRQVHKAQPADTLLAMGDLSTMLPELMWLHDSVDTNYDLILDIRNECAVAALALHLWTLYQYNNRIYTQLFKELSADNTLDDYCRKMEQSQTNRQVAVIMLVLLFLGILAAVAWQLIVDMRITARRRQEQQDRLDMLGDEVQRLTLEANALHVSNSVLDNTLSTLKHETMYYPSRILQMVKGIEEGSERSDNEKSNLKEVVAYYRELYGMLNAQSMSQVEKAHLHLAQLDHEILGDDNLIRYLFEILRKESGQRELHVDYIVSDTRYVECRVKMPSLQRTDLFTPSQTANIPFLLCRQIVRDHGEATNRRACAIRAEKEGQGVAIVIILPRVSG